jgi:FAD/FMN-containing dehydrogenase/Fe-S oxidoreductase
MAAHIEVEAVQELTADLEKAIGRDQVKFDRMTRLLYSTDASNYQIVPLGVTFPRHADDVVAVHEIARKHGAPLLPRGGGSSLAGQTVGRAVVMDFTRYMRRVRSINGDTASVVVEPGTILGQLNKQVRSLGLMFGPDPASAQRASVGGCIGNNSTGSHSILYGLTADHIRRMEVVLASGERMWLDANTATLNRVRDQIRHLALEQQEEIKARFPKTFRTVAGYALNKIDPEAVNLNWLFAGSEGTLGTIVQAELGLVPVPTMRRLALVHFDTVRESLEATPRILELEPSAVEMMDRMLIDKARSNPEFAPRLMRFVEGDPASVLAVEFFGENAAYLASRIDALKEMLQRIGHKGAVTLAITPQEQASVWSVREVGLGLLMSERGDAKPLPFVEDAAVPVEHLADYIDDIDRIVHDAGTTYSIYAHASAGCLHVRPLINLKSERGRQQYRQIAAAAAQTVVKYQGTITGEHGKGLARSEFGELLFGPELTQAFRQIKKIFDPDNLMNPGKIVDAPAMDDPSTLRYNPDYHVIELKTRYDWSLDGGLSGAAEMCNGAGVCRKEGEGTMCPSYMATLDESHATRGRANALRLAMSGYFKPDNIGSQAVHDVFDLCLSCKACKAECPSSVDVARMKAEFLAAYHDIHGTPLKSRIFANIHRLNAWGSLMPAVTNWLLTHPLGLAAARVAGVPTDRPLPRLSSQRFSQWVPQTIRPQATLVIDTFTEFNHPEIGHALLKIARVLDVQVAAVRLPGQGCCGRPAMSKGVLDLAKNLANANVEFLSTHLNAGPLLFLEPSCMSAFTDDYLGLADPALMDKARQVADRCVMAETWLVDRLAEVTQSLNWDGQTREILLHGHCHQKALWGTAGTKRLLASIPGAQVSEIDSGCCGVAGSFGYEHYDLSLKIANQRLLPAIAARPQALVAAPGTSCRTQISEAGYAVWHPIEIVAQALQL